MEADKAGAPDDLGGPDILGALGRWGRRSATGALLAGLGLTLREIFKQKQEQVVIAEVDPSGPDGPDEALELHLHPDHPAMSWAVVRRHSRFRS